VGALAFPTAVGIVVVAPVFVEVVLGEKWLPVIATMQLLTAYGAVSALTVAFDQLWKAIGRPGLVTKVSGFRLLLLAGGIYPLAVQFGIEGVAAAIVGVNLVAVPLGTFISARLIGFSYRAFGRELAYPAAASLAMGAVVLAVRQAFQPALRGLELVVLVACGVVVYLLATALLDGVFGWGIGRNVRTLVDAVRG
jgi:O-antigen/teichoic acid export membrane protein